MTEELAYLDKLDRLEGAMIHQPQVICPVTHRFTPGLYIREIFIPAGTLLTSAIHKTEHPFVVSVGVIRVHSGDDAPETFEAPYLGITKPGTRRLLLALEDTVWTTFHPTLRGPAELDAILADLVDDPPNPYVTADFIPAYRNPDAMPCLT
jgi:hypothetical protein